MNDNIEKYEPEWKTDRHYVICNNDNNGRRRNVGNMRKYWMATRHVMKRGGREDILCRKTMQQ